MKKSRSFSLLILFFTVLFCNAQEVEKREVEFKRVITPYDTLNIEKGKKYFDYYDSCMYHFSKFWQYLDIGMIEEALSINDELIIKYPY